MTPEDLKRMSFNAKEGGEPASEFRAAELEAKAKATPAPLPIPDDLWGLFHRLWGIAKASPEYDKEVCRRLEAKIFALEKPPSPPPDPDRGKVVLDALEAFGRKVLTAEEHNAIYDAVIAAERQKEQRS